MAAGGTSSVGLVLAQTSAGLDPGQVLGFVLLDIAIILAVARLVGALACKVGQPRVVGEIVAGVLLGPTLLGRTLFAWDQPWSFLHCDAAVAAVSGAPSITECLFPPQARAGLGLLGQIALVLFMFLVGLELDWEKLRGKGKSIAAVASGAVVVPVVVGVLIGPLLYRAEFVGGFGTSAQTGELTFSLFVAAMLSVTAFPVMARMLQEKGLTQSPMGSIGIASAAVVTILMFLILAVAAGVAADQGPFGLTSKFLLTSAFVAGLFLVVRPALVPLGRRYETSGTLDPGFFAAVVILVFASAYVAHQLGINVIVGGFLAGAVLPARSALFRDMASRLADVTAVVLLPIFLAFSGLNTDFTQLTASAVPGIALFLVAGVAGKWLGTAVSARAGGLSWPESNVLGILMNCRGLLILVVALIAFEQGVISAQLQVGGVLMALATTMMTGPLFDAFTGEVQPAPPPEEALATAEPGVVRVLAAVDDLDDAPMAVGTAVGLIGEHRPAEVVLCHLFPVAARVYPLSGINDEALEVARSSRFLRSLDMLTPSGVVIVPLPFSSVDPASDLLRIATERSCDAVVVNLRPLDSGGIGLQSVVDRLTMESRCPVVAFRAGVDGQGGGTGPVTVVDSGDGDALADRLGHHLATCAGRVLDHPQVADGAAWTAAAAHSSAVVVSGDAGFPETLDGVSCPLYVVCRSAGQVDGDHGL